MPSTYTLNNGIELIGTGEQSGTWGSTTNTNLELLDTALDGQVTVTLSSTGSSGSPNALPISDGSNSDGRNRLITFNDGSDLGGTAYVQLTPNDAEKIIYVRNSLSGSRSILLFQGTYNASNDYEVPAGTTAVVFFNGAGTGAVAANVFNNAYFDSLRLGGVSVTAILDEDNMASNSATALSTQQSIKAYVDSQVTAQDLDFGGDSGTGAVDLDSQTFTIAGTANEIETSASGQTLTVGLPDNVTIAGDLTVDTDTLYVDSTNNKIGIKTTSPDDDLHIRNTAQTGATFRLENSNTSTDSNTVYGTINFEGNDDSASANGIRGSIAGKSEGISGQLGLVFSTASGNASQTEAMTIDSSQRVLIGAASSTTIRTRQSALQSNGTGTDAGASFTRWSNGGGGPYLTFAHSRSTTANGGFAILQDGDAVGSIDFAGADGVDLATPVATITASVDGTPGSNDMPGRLEFYTTADGTNSPTERMRIDNAGRVIINGADVSTGTGTNKGLLQVANIDTTYDWTQINTDANAYASTANEIAVLNTANNDANGFAGLFMQAGEASNGSTISAARIGAIRVTTNSAATDLGFAVRGGNAIMAEAMRINSTGYAIISSTGNTRTMSLGSTVSRLTIEGTSATAGRPGAAAVQNSNDTSGPVYYLAKSRGTANNSVTIVLDNDYLGQLNWNGADGTQMVQAGNISLRVDGTPGVNDMPARLEFHTTSDGANSPQMRAKIDSDGLFTAYQNILIDADANSTLFLGKGKEGVDGVVKIKTVQTGGDSDQLGLSFYTHPSSSGSSLSEEAGRFTAPGQFIVGGGYTYVQNWYGTTGINDRQINAYNEGGNAALTAVSASASTGQSAQLNLGKMGTSDLTAFGIVEDNEDLGLISFQGADGTYLQEAARIMGEVDGTPGAADMPGRLSFRTTADGGTSPTEHLRITQNGRIYAYTQITNSGVPYAATDSFHAIYNSSSAKTGTLMTANNGNTWLNADGGMQLWLNWYSINNSASKTDTVIGDGAGGDYIVQVDASARDVNIKNALLNFETSGDGILFSGNSRTNAFNDYERGSWTPTITQITTAPSVSYSIRNGSYTKIGNMVYAFWDCTTTSVSGGSGQFNITGLPFSASVQSVMAGYSVIQVRSNSLVASSISGDQLKGYIAGTTLYFELDNSGSAGYGTRTASVGLNSSGRTSGYIIYATT